ncbi:MAG: tryptophan halogenase family protein [Xanthomonadaceae bacterium]|nr:tryptophan halogenase family protein [Xanthomonadaceae bacterium]
MVGKQQASTKRIVVVGGGSAGWITAGLIAARHAKEPGSEVTVTLVESPQIATIGVGEGTWPTMRTTLERIGISEATFIRECSASFKQGTRFVGWVDGRGADIYYHPFTSPAGYPHDDLAALWVHTRGERSFADAVSPQGMVCDRNLGPKQVQTPEYAGVLNYAYHLDAGKFAELLARHCTDSLGVRHIRDRITAVESDEDGDIAALSTESSGPIPGDLFIDCSGTRSMLLGDHYGVALVDRSDVLFNDRALAIQVPYPNADTPVASQTISTAQSCGWIWDIGLASRRGTGYVYSSRHCDDDDAWQVLEGYLRETGAPSESIQAPRTISFLPGYRERFWHRNCVAVGMSSGFIEPLEASALVMVELSARMIAEELPANREIMEIVARRFNRKFRHRWERIIDFLKLHYVLGKRVDSAYWQDHRACDSVPESLRELMELWRFRPPVPGDFPEFDEIFSAASYQYVLYGMGFQSARVRSLTDKERANAVRLAEENRRLANQCLARLPSNRALLDQILHHGLPAAG